MRLFFIVLLFFSTLLEAQTLRIGVIKFYPPFEIEVNNSGQFTGFDSNFISAICQNLKVNCTFTSLMFNDLFNSLNDNKIDLAISAISITKERERNYLFSLPYLASFIQFITLKDNSINSIEDLKHKNIGMFTSSITEEFLQMAKKNDIHIKQYIIFNDLLSDLASTKVDAIVLDYYVARYWVATPQSRLKLIGKKIRLGNGYGIMASKKNVALIQAINQIILKMESNGEYLKLYNVYFGSF